jgi:hypothetical protein
MEKANVNIIINEQHTLSENQVNVLNETFNPVNYRHILVKVPATGLNLKEQMEICNTVEGKVVFVSPIPAMIKRLVATKGADEVLIFCNDKREKKELPNGKVIYVVAQDGWYLF